MGEFTIERVSPAGDVPAITFQVRGDTMRAEMANGAKLYAELRDPVYTDRNLGPAADLRITDATGFVLADIVVNGRPEINLTENTADVGAALLWSHWRFVEADKRWCEERDRKLADPNRCAVCGWPLVARVEQGCVRGNCSMRPPPAAFYDAKRAELETKSIRELIAKSSIGAGLADIKERGIDAHLADAEKGKR